MSIYPTKVDILFNKRSINSKLTDYDISALRGNIQLLEKLMNKMLQLMCENKNRLVPRDIANQIRSQLGPEIDNQLCLGRTSSNTTVNTSANNDILALITDATNAKDNTTKLPALADNNFANLYILYCIIMVYRKAYNTVRNSNITSSKLVDLESDIQNKGTNIMGAIHKTKVVPTLPVSNVLNSLVTIKVDQRIELNTKLDRIRPDVQQLMDGYNLSTNDRGNLYAKCLVNMFRLIGTTLGDAIITVGIRPAAAAGNEAAHVMAAAELCCRSRNLIGAYNAIITLVGGDTPEKIEIANILITIANLAHTVRQIANVIAAAPVVPATAAGAGAAAAVAIAAAPAAAAVAALNALVTGGEPVNLLAAGVVADDFYTSIIVSTEAAVAAAVAAAFEYNRIGAAGINAAAIIGIAAVAATAAQVRIGGPDANSVMLTAAIAGAVSVAITPIAAGLGAPAAKNASAAAAAVAAEAVVRLVANGAILAASLELGCTCASAAAAAAIITYGGTLAEIETAVLAAAHFSIAANAITDTDIEAVTTSIVVATARASANGTLAEARAAALVGANAANGHNNAPSILAIRVGINGTITDAFILSTKVRAISIALNNVIIASTISAYGIDSNIINMGASYAIANSANVQQGAVAGIIGIINLSAINLRISNVVNDVNKYEALAVTVIAEFRANDKSAATETVAAINAGGAVAIDHDTMINAILTDSIHLLPASAAVRTAELAVAIGAAAPTVALVNAQAAKDSAIAELIADTTAALAAPALAAANPIINRLLQYPTTYAKFYSILTQPVPPPVSHFDAMLCAMIVQRDLVGHKLIKIYNEPNIFNRAKTLVDHEYALVPVPVPALNTLALFKAAIDSLQPLPLPALTLVEIFNTINTALDFTRQSDQSRRSIKTTPFINFADSLNGYKIGHQIYSIQPPVLVGNISNNLPEILKKLPLSKTELSTKTLLGLNRPIDDQTVASPIDEHLNNLLRTAILNTLESDNHLYTSLIISYADLVVDYVKTIESRSASSTTTTNTGDCSNLPKMFDQQNLENMIYGLVKNYNSGLMNKICRYSQVPNHVSPNIMIGGNQGNPFINLRDILTESSNQTEDSGLFCTQVNDKIVCQHSKSKSKSKSSRRCDFCEKWKKDRDMFKQLINEMLNQDQVTNIIELMKDNLHLFPAAILNQEKYHFFHTSLEEFKKMKK